MIFVNTRETADKIETFFETVKNQKVVKLIGGMKEEERDEAIDSFRRLE